MKKVCVGFVVGMFVLIALSSFVFAINVLPTDGNVGIGTDSPERLFQVDGMMGIYGDKGGIDFHDRNGGGSSNYWVAYNEDGKLKFWRGGDDKVVFDRSGNADFSGKVKATGKGDDTGNEKLDIYKWQGEFGASGKGSVLIGTWGNQPSLQGAGTGTSYRLLLNPYNGNVGIGTHNPQAKLDVAGKVRSGYGFSVVRNDNYAGYMWSGDNEKSYWNIGNKGDVSKAMISSGSKNVMTFVSSGNVGIGTDNPQVKLEVVGQGDDMGNEKLDIYKWQGEFGTSGAGSILIGTWANQPSLQGHGTGTSYKLLLNPYAGNVGIGTHDPQAKLHVNGGSMIIERDDGWPGTSYVSGDQTWVVGMYSGENFYIRDADAKKDRLKIDSDGIVYVKEICFENGKCIDGTGAYDSVATPIAPSGVAPVVETPVAPPVAPPVVETPVAPPVVKAPVIPSIPVVGGVVISDTALYNSVYARLSAKDPGMAENLKAKTVAGNLDIEFQVDMISRLQKVDSGMAEGVRRNLLRGTSTIDKTLGDYVVEYTSKDVCAFFIWGCKQRNQGVAENMRRRWTSSKGVYVLDEAYQHSLLDYLWAVDRGTAENVYRRLMSS